jgi:hypothetical protein
MYFTGKSISYYLKMLIVTVLEIACIGPALYFRYDLDNNEIIINTCFMNKNFQGNLESSYVKSVLDIYELVLQTSPNFKNDSTDKVKQEVLRGLGNL